MRMRSPSRTNAIGPPSTASGATWPMQNPHVPPREAAVGDQRAVGAATGALQRAGDRRASRACPDRPSGPRSGSRSPCPAGSRRRGSTAIAPSSPSNTRAGPSNCFCSLLSPATFTTAPFGASDPVRMLMPPSVWIGCVERVHHHAVGRRRVDVGEVLGHRLAGAPSSRRRAAARRRGGASARPARRRRGRGRSCGTCRPASCRRCAARGGDPVEVVEVAARRRPRWRWPAGAAPRSSSHRAPR